MRERTAVVFNYGLATRLRSSLDVCKPHGSYATNERNATNERKRTLRTNEKERYQRKTQARCKEDEQSGSNEDDQKTKKRTGVEKGFWNQPHRVTVETISTGGEKQGRHGIRVIHQIAGCVASRLTPVGGAAGSGRVAASLSAGANIPRMEREQHLDAACVERIYQAPDAGNASRPVRW